jgi:hypothetical protein
MDAEGQFAPHPDDAEKTLGDHQTVDKPTVSVYKPGEPLPAPRPAVRKMSPRFWNRIMDKIGERLDHRDVPRWDIAGADSFTEQGNSLVITDTHGERHIFDKSKIDNFYYVPLASQPEKLDLIIWEKRADRPRSTRPIYAGTFRHNSDVPSKIDQLRS